MTDVYAKDPEKQAILDELRVQADAMGLKYHHRAGIDKLKLVIAESQAVSAPGAAEMAMSDDQFAKNNTKSDHFHMPPGAQMLTEEQFQQQFGETPQQKASKLVRCRIQCMNPVKREWEGEILTVSNSLGTWKKYVPFNNEPYHLPQILFDFIKDRECVTFVTKRVGPGKGDMTKEPRLIKEFAIEELPPLTAKELKDLGQRQAMAAGTADAA